MHDFKIFRTYIRKVLIENLDDGQILSQYAHRGQKRRTGEPYFFHPQGVANIVKKYYPSDQAAYYAALLHDAIEDGIPLGNIEDQDELYTYLLDIIPDDDLVDDVFNSISALTKQEGGDYYAYISSLLSEPTALRVKISDMMHNLSDFPSPKQLKKYSKTLDILGPSGQSPAHITNDHWEAFKDQIKNAK